MAAKIEEEKCTGCGKCIDMCPVAAITIEDLRARISEDCIECGACIGECPNEALSLK